MKFTLQWQMEFNIRHIANPFRNESSHVYSPYHHSTQFKSLHENNKHIRTMSYLLNSSNNSQQKSIFFTVVIVLSISFIIANFFWLIQNNLLYYKVNFYYTSINLWSVLSSWTIFLILLIMKCKHVRHRTFLLSI